MNIQKFKKMYSYMTDDNSHVLPVRVIMLKMAKDY